MNKELNELVDISIDAMRRAMTAERVLHFILENNTSIRRPTPKHYEEMSSQILDEMKSKYPNLNIRPK